MADKKPTVSVALPVYNGEAHLKEAVESILNQSFADFELIIIDDGSTDGSSRILDSFRDRRIVRTAHATNLGLIKTLNEAMALAKGAYLVRADADDMSLPERLEKLVGFMGANPGISIAGSWMRQIGSKKGELLFPSSGASAASRLLLGDTVEPSSSIMRLRDLTNKGLVHEEKYRYANEYSLHVRAVMAGLSIANVPRILLEKRIHSGQTSALYETRVQGVESMAIQKAYFSFLVRKLKFLDPRYIRAMMGFACLRVSNRLRFSLKQISLKIKELRFYSVPFDDCFHMNCNAQELKDKGIVDLVTIAFNKPELIRWQIRLIRKNFLDPHFYTVCDNSSDKAASDEIREVCSAEKVAYVRLPENHLTRDSSHGSALNWVCRNYLAPRRAHYLGFIDHDLFPARKTGLNRVLDEQPVYGHIQIRKDLWYLWNGFCFFKATAAIPQKLNFMSYKIGSVALDGGGMNWKMVYSKLDRDKLRFPTHTYEKIRESRDAVASAHDIGQDHVEYIDGWVHLVSSSGWKKMAGQDERDEKVRSLIESFLR